MWSRLLFLSLFARAAGGGSHSPKSDRQPDEQGQVGDVVDKAIGQNGGPGTALRAEHKREDQIPHAGAIRHDQGSQDRPLKTPGCH